MANYSKHAEVTPEWEELLKTTTVPGPGTVPGQTVEDYQTATNRGREQTSKTWMQENNGCEKVHIKDISIPSRDGTIIPARAYWSRSLTTSSPLPVYLYFHGGGFLFGNLNSEDANCTRLALALPIVVLHVCYRHTPAFKHPTQSNDAWDSFEWLLANYQMLNIDPHRIVVGGVSAGGALAAMVGLKNHQQPSPEGSIVGQVLCIPWLVHPDTYEYSQLESPEVSSYVQCRDAPVLPKQQADLFTNLLAVDEPSSEELFVGHARDEEVRGLPKTAFLIAGRDMLRDEAFLYEEKLRRNG